MAIKRKSNFGNDKLKFVDLFSGIGGMRLAGESLNMKCVFSSEIDKHAIATYVENFGEQPLGDISKIGSKDIPNFDILMAGFPCQPFSYAGAGKGLKDRRGNLFFEVSRILKEKQPKYFLLENVKGLVSHDKGRTLSVIEEELRGIGYNFTWRVINSKDFGLPQNRERWYCIGFKKKEHLKAFQFPEPPSSKLILKDIIDQNNRDESLVISELWSSRIDRHFRNIKKERVPHFDFEKEGSKRSQHGVFSFLKADKSIRFHMGDFKKTQIQEGFFVSLETESSPTLIAGRVPQLWDLKRKLSVAECARLQGFPKSFQFPCSSSQSYKQLGNSVSVPVITALLEAIEDVHRNVGYDSRTNLDLVG